MLIDMKNKGAGKGFVLLSKNTNEYGKDGVLIRALNAHVLPKVTKNSLLDIGSGQGSLAIPLSKVFKETVTVEPDKKFFDQLIKMGRGRISGFNKKWEETNLERRFNLILAIHIFYYIPPKYWLKQLKRMLDALDRKGKIVIVLQSKLSRLYKFPNQFLEKESQINSEKLMENLKFHNIKFISYKLHTTIWANNRKKTITLGNFLLDAHNVSPDNKKATDLWSYKRGNKFFINNTEHLVVVFK